MSKFIQEFMSHPYRFLVLVVVLVSLIFNIYNGIYIDKLEQQVVYRDSIITKLTFSDKLVKDYFDINYDSTKHQTYYTLKDNKKTIVNDTTKSTITKTHAVYYKETVTYTNNKKYNDLAKKYNSLISDYNLIVHKYNTETIKSSENEQKLFEKQYSLDMIKKHYGIKYMTTRNGDYLSIELKSNKIDSALALFPYYKDKLSYDSKDKCWIIEMPKVKKRRK